MAIFTYGKSPTIYKAFINHKNNKKMSNETRGRETILIHVLSGGMSGMANPQQQPFFDAVRVVKAKYSAMIEIIVEYKTCRDLKDSKWTSQDTVNWLIDCDIYAITCHPHQGMEASRWDMDDLAIQMERLGQSGTVGCPNSLQIKCPMWSQNKFDYLTILSEFVLNTLKVPLRDISESEDSFSFSMIKEIKEFFDANATTDTSGKTTRGGVVVKAPFTTGDS